MPLSEENFAQALSVRVIAIATKTAARPLRRNLQFTVILFGIRGALRDRKYPLLAKRRRND
jgi:hypothetical protein